jgi:uncharacterized membrane protein
MLNSIQVHHRIAIVTLVTTLTCWIVLLVASGLLVRAMAGVILVLLLPGYLLLRLLWPKANEPNFLWRVAMILPISIALVGALLLLVNYFGAYEYASFLGMLALVNVGMALGVFARGGRLAFAGPESSDRHDTLIGRARRYKPSAWHGALVLACVAFAGSIVYAGLTPRSSIGLTEFYALSADGALPLSNSGNNEAELEVRVGITNREGRAADYQLMVLSNTSDNNVALWSGSVTVPDNSVVEKTLSLPVSQDTESLQFLLFLDYPRLYRSLRLHLGSP